VISGYGNFSTKESFYMRKELNPHRVFWNTNMAAVFLFCTPILLPGRHVKKVYLEELKIFPQQWRIQGEGPRPFPRPPLKTPVRFKNYLAL